MSTRISSSQLECWRYLWRDFGFEGEIWTELFNPLVAAQNFEYKILKILDIPSSLYVPISFLAIESFFLCCLNFTFFSRELVFEYITALPGASSSYRYIALKIGGTGEGIVREKKTIFFRRVEGVFPLSCFV